MPNKKENGIDKQDTLYEETMSAIGLQGTVDTTYGDSMSMRASNRSEIMRSSRATSTPSGGQSFEGFVPMSYPVRHGNQIYFGDHYDDTDYNIRNTEETYDSHFGEEEVQERSIVTKVKKEICTQTELHDLSRDSTDLEWDGFLGKYYSHLGAGLIAEWEEMIRDTKALRKYVRRKIREQLDEFQVYNHYYTDTIDFSLRKALILSILDGLVQECDKMIEQTDNLKCRTRSLPVIELGFKVKDTKELVLRARIDLAAIERNKSEESLRRMGDYEYQQRLQEQELGEPIYEPHGTKDRWGDMTPPPVIPREQPRDNSDNRE